MDPATVDQQFDEIVRNSSSSAPIPMRNLSAELAARLVVLTSFTAAVLLFEIHPLIVVLVAVGIVSLATAEALVDRQALEMPSDIDVRV